jgi:Flp pilus assembly pilin Flp
MKLWIRIVHGERGANLIEYGLLAMLIAVAAVLAIQFFGQSNNELFEKIADNL